MMVTGSFYFIKAFKYVQDGVNISVVIQYFVNIKFIPLIFVLLPQESEVTREASDDKVSHMVKTPAPRAMKVHPALREGVNKTERYSHGEKRSTVVPIRLFTMQGAKNKRVKLAG